MKYAILESGGKQFRAVEGGTIEVDRLPVEPGAKIKLEQVLLLADGEKITVGQPLIKDTPVWTSVVEHFRGPKVNIFNYSPKKRIRVKIGHRQNYTRLLVEQIGGSELIKKEPVKVEKAVEAETVKEGPKAKAPRAAKPEAESKVEAPSLKTKKPAAKNPVKAAANSSPKGKTPAKKPDVKKPAVKKPAAAKAEPKAAAKK